MSALTEEAHSAQTDRWFVSRGDERFLTSDWGVAEFSSALSIKLRMGKVSLEKRREAMALFAQFTANSFEILPVARKHFRMAARFADQHELGLRGADALHLAICQDHRTTLCTLDKRMRDAAIALGIAAISPTPPV